MMKNVSFYSEGVKLDGDIYYPENMTDGEQRTLDFEIALADVPDGFRVGSIQTVVSYTETSGLLADPPDSVAANGPQTDMEAQWTDNNNTLSGSSNDASDIELLLRTHPGFTGQAVNATGLNEYQVLQPWLVEGYGLSLIHI